MLTKDESALRHVSETQSPSMWMNETQLLYVDCVKQETN
jgi:hypothetical protein